MRRTDPLGNQGVFFFVPTTPNAATTIAVISNQKNSLLFTHAWKRVKHKPIFRGEPMNKSPVPNNQSSLPYAPIPDKREGGKQKTSERMCSLHMLVPVSARRNAKLAAVTSGIPFRKYVADLLANATPTSSTPDQAPPEPTIAETKGELEITLPLPSHERTTNPKDSKTEGADNNG